MGKFQRRKYDLKLKRLGVELDATNKVLNRLTVKRDKLFSDGLFLVQLLKAEESTTVKNKSDFAP